MNASDLGQLAERVGPVLIFLVAITVVAEIADLAGVFDVAAHWAARAGRGRAWLLWLLIVALSCACTIVLSLDTTAVLLTPVVITLARQVGLSALPFVMTTVWLANTASLLLPVSNLTNLLALHRFRALGLDYSSFIAVMAWPAVAAILATVALLWLLHRRPLGIHYTAQPPATPHDRTLLVTAAIVCIGLGPGFASGVVPALPASFAAVLLAGVCLVRAPQLLRRVRVPWLIVVGVVVLFVLIDLAGPHGLTALLRTWAGSGTSGPDLLRVAATGAGSANVVNNLPAYLALEPIADADPLRLAALLIGVNCGPLVTAWGSLATLLWRDRCRRGGLRISLPRLALEGSVCAIVTILAAVTALALA